jgi:hypothetical protein
MTGEKIIVVSHHLLRRRARLAAARLNIIDPLGGYTVRKAGRGPWRWYCVKRI